MSANVGIITDSLSQLTTDSSIQIITSQAFGLGSVLVSFKPPANTGGTPITGYTVTSSPGGITASGVTSPILVTGLTDGTVYTFTVTAMNAVGTGPPSAPSNPEAPSGAPGAPTNLTASALNGSASVAFTPPSDTGGAPITQYIVTSSPGGFTESAAASPIIVNGLTNGVAYTFTAVAVNVNGAGPPSSPSNSVTPVAAVPNPPTGLTAVGGNGQATVSFMPPLYDGGSAIIGYTVTSNPGSISAHGSASPIVVTGLANGTSYTFTAVAINVAGSSAASAPSNSIIPTGVPGAPTAVVGTPENASVSVAFTAPASTGGSPITGYTATSSPGGFTASGASSPLTVTGLTNGTAYTFTVTATNAGGTGPASVPSAAVTPRAVPGAPTAVSGAAGNAQVIVTFTAPSSTGGSPITGYTVTASPGGATKSGASSPLTVTGLTNGTSYTFTVTAQNIAGTGPASAPSAAVTPFTIPGAATALNAVPGNASATVFFSAAPANGSPVTSYTLTSSPGGFTGTGATSPIAVTGLTNGTAYTFTAVATNAAGAGPASAPSNSVTPAAVPGSPTAVAGTPGNAQVVVSFTAPSSTGGSPITGYTVTASPGGATATGASSPLTVTGLTNGTAYTFTVVATNSAGNSPPSTPSGAVTPFTIPGAATSLVATRGNASASIAFTAAPNNGSAITSYTLTSSPGGFTGSGATSPVTVSGLTNGTAYTFTAVATNAAGAGPASAPSNSVTPATVPGAPTTVIGTAGNAQVSVSFTAPGSNGGSAITSYTATSSPSGFTKSGAASPLVVTGLSNGTPYTFTVTATNAIGTGAASSPSSAVTPYTVPGAATSLSATPGNMQATITFTAAPANGSPVTNYIATSNPGALTGSASASPVTVTGLTNGTSYDFTIVATNAAGAGAVSAPSNFVTPFTIPGAATSLSASAGNASASISFTAAPNNGSPITSYTLTSSPGGLTGSGASSPVTVSGLTNGTAYTFTAVATNAAGPGPASSASNSVTPSGAAATMPFITSTTLPGAQVGLAYSLAIQAAMGLTPYTATLVSQTGGNGFALSSTGLLTCTPVSAGSCSLVISFSDSTPGTPLTTGSVTFTVNVVAASATVTFTGSTTLPHATNGGMYFYKMPVSGGIGPVSVKLAPVSATNTWYAQCSADQLYIYGAPTSNTTDTVGITATDTAGNTTGAVTFSITTTAALAFQNISLDQTSRPLPAMYVSAAYSYTVRLAGGTGTSQSLAVTSGALPAGLSFSGLKIAGTPTTAGSGSATIQASDSGGAGPSFVFTWTVLASQAVTRPSYNPSGNNNFFVKSGQFYDPNGTPFRMRGINQGNYGDGTTTTYTAMNPNIVRLDCYYTVSESAIFVTASYQIAAGRFCIGMRDAPINTVWIAGNPSGSGSSNVQILNGLLQDWLNYKSDWQSSPLLGVNIANEWGPTNINWQYAHQAVITPIASVAGNVITLTSSAATNPYANFAVSTAVYIPPGFGLASNMYAVASVGGTSGVWTVTLSTTPNTLSGTYTSGGSLYMGSVALLRGMGYKNVLFIDSSYAGQSFGTIISYAPAVMASDPLQNCVFCCHPYNTITNTAMPISNITKASQGVVSYYYNNNGFQPFNIGTGGTVHIYGGAAYFAGVGGMTAINGQNPTLANNNGGTVPNCTVTLNLNTSGFGAYTGGGFIYPLQDTQLTWYQFYISQLAAMQNQGVCVMLEEFGPVSPPSNSPVSSLATSGDIITAAEANNINWSYWSADDGNSTFGAQITPAGPTYTGANANATLTVFGLDVIGNPAYGLQALATLNSYFL